MTIPRMLNVLPSLACLILFGACSSDGGESTTHSVVIAQMTMIVSAEDDGSVNGLNLDGRVDETPAPETCNKLDFTAPDGTPGIDNQLSLFGPILAMFGGDPQALLQGSINEGSLLLMLQFEGLNSFENDENVTVRVLFGTGPTDVGNDGVLVPGQSFDVRPDTDSIEIRNVRLVDGHMEGGTTGVIVLPVRILQNSFDLPLFSLRFSLRLNSETGEVTGTIGGSIPVQRLIEEILRIPGGDSVAPIATLTLGRMGDMVPDEMGACSQVSAGIEVRGVQAFVLPPADSTDGTGDRRVRDALPPLR